MAGEPICQLSGDGYGGVIANHGHRGERHGCVPQRVAILKEYIHHRTLLYPYSQLYPSSIVIKFDCF